MISTNRPASLFFSSTLKNSVIANLLQTIFTALLLFIVYRLLKDSIGIERFGVWAVVVSLASTSRLIDMGLSSGITKFVAKAVAAKRPSEAAQIIETNLITLAVLSAIVLMLIYQLSPYLFEYVFKKNDLVQALEISPIVFLVLWFSIVGSVIQSALDGCQKIVARSVLVIISQFIFFAFSLILIPRFHLIGVIAAQFLQSFFLLLCGWPILRRALPELSFIPSIWKWRVLKEMFGYNLNVQISSILIMLFDPITKFVLVKFGGPASAGYFEMANQIVSKTRGLIVYANQTVVSRIASIVETDSSALNAFYFKNFKVALVFAAPIFTFLFFLSTFFSILMLGEYQYQFVLFLNLLILAWFVNAITSPAYFFNIGKGDVALNTFSHAITGFLNLFLSYFYGYYGYGANGVVFGYALSLILGSTVFIIMFNKKNDFELISYQDRDSLKVLICCLFGIIIFFIFNLLFEFYVSAFYLKLVALFISLLVVFQGVRKTSIWNEIFDTKPNLI